MEAINAKVNAKLNAEIEESHKRNTLVYGVLSRLWGATCGADDDMAITMALRHYNHGMKQYIPGVCFIG